MAGGTFDSQNKVRAGVYLKFKAMPVISSPGARGAVAICEQLSWGPNAEVMRITEGSNIQKLTGYPIDHEKNRFIREIFKDTNRTAGPAELLLYRAAATSSATATATVGNLTATAQYPGARGNDISITVIAPASGSLYTVITTVGGTVIDTQLATTVAGLVDNDWVKFAGTGAFTATAGTALTGGADGTLASTAHASFLSAIESYHFDVLCYDGTDSTTLAAYISFIQRLAVEAGKFAQLVVAGATAPNNEHVINVACAVVLEDGTSLAANQVTWWAAGATAGAKYNESLTYAQYPGAASVSTVMDNADYVEAIEAGKFVLFADLGKVYIEADIDSLTSVSEDRPKSFKKNRTMRLLNQLANWCAAEFAANYIGVISNTESGRALYKAAVVGYLLNVQANDGIKNFSSDDVQVYPGEEPDAVILAIQIQPVDATEKIYITIQVA